ncbi:sodium channel subunit beta-2-like [Myxocyprinus asiaticus]|uniref:sodium channel subunit beta-2-like n=1 Tax=Myxocyprinus asiaticus TaxID=70543 RepID=UPI002222C64F|nr:sodium channel subunit beta-2-like [Myxocyprinus asiaticus]
MQHYAELILCFVTLAVTHGVKHEILSFSGEDVLLRCAASSEPDVQYRSVIWYKVIKGPSRQLTGLIMKRLTQSNSKVEKYKNVERDIELLEDSKYLLLPSVTTEDSGIYSCFLSAPLGYQNQEGEVHLKVHEHPKVEETQSTKNDTIYVMVAITVLVLALLMLCISYVCVRNVPQGSKKLTKDFWLKMPHQGKKLIVTLQSKNLVCKTLPEVYV